jgi:RHS repeat-associated protein
LLPQPFKYAGQYGILQEPNGLYYMRARYYDAAVGRFISEDPIGFDSGEVNLYAYVGNNPISFIDPFGLEASGNKTGNGWSTALDFVSNALIVGDIILGGPTGEGIGPAIGIKALQKSGVQISSKVPAALTGFTEHGIERVIQRGVSPSSILDAIKNPVKIKEAIDALGRVSYQVIGKKASVVLNEFGKVITTWPK